MTGEAITDHSDVHQSLQKKDKCDITFSTQYNEKLNKQNKMLSTIHQTWYHEDKERWM